MVNPQVRLTWLNSRSVSFNSPAYHPVLKGGIPMDQRSTNSASCINLFAKTQKPAVLRHGPEILKREPLITLPILRSLSIDRDYRSNHVQHLFDDIGCIAIHAMLVILYSSHKKTMPR